MHSHGPQHMSYVHYILYISVLALVYYKAHNDDQYSANESHSNHSNCKYLCYKWCYCDVLCMNITNLLHKQVHV